MIKAPYLSDIESEYITYLCNYFILRNLWACLGIIGCISFAFEPIEKSSFANINMEENGNKKS